MIPMVSGNYMLGEWGSLLSSDPIWDWSGAGEDSFPSQTLLLEEPFEQGQQEFPMETVRRSEGSSGSQPQGCAQCLQNYSPTSRQAGLQTPACAQFNPMCPGHECLSPIEGPPPNLQALLSTDTSGSQSPGVRAQSARIDGRSKLVTVLGSGKTNDQDKVRPARRSSGRKRLRSCISSEFGSGTGQDLDITTPDTNQLAKQGPTSHAFVERKYRDGLNSKISQLHSQLEQASGQFVSEPDGDSVRKGDVLVRAIQYIKFAERERSLLSDEKGFLQQRILSLEKLVKCENCVIRSEVSRLLLVN